MNIKIFLGAILLNISLFAHGVFYEVVDGAIGIRVTAPNNIAISNAAITIYAPEASLAFTKGKTDVNGNFAFMPDSHGEWRVKINVPSSHGAHLKDFKINIDKDFKVKSYEKVPYDRYMKILSALGFLLGIFGIIILFKNRKGNIAK
ncbi:carboxypeptidase-like regulatory domain-containing protein [Arcobacter sp.]|uniref:carboxypeptidase-like regulatory domain-containing protein n=1 Tax=Arcobacter sp. TaxID=1872629 RepID=UPI003C76D878